MDTSSVLLRQNDEARISQVTGLVMISRSTLRELQCCAAYRRAFWIEVTESNLADERKAVFVLRMRVTSSAKDYYTRKGANSINGSGSSCGQ